MDTGRKVLNLQHRSARALPRVGARRNPVGAVRVILSALGPQPGALGPCSTLGRCGGPCTRPPPVGCGESGEAGITLSGDHSILVNGTDGNTAVLRLDRGKPEIRLPRHEAAGARLLGSVLRRGWAASSRSVQPWVGTGWEGGLTFASPFRIPAAIEPRSDRIWMLPPAVTPRGAGGTPLPVGRSRSRARNWSPATSRSAPSRLSINVAKRVSQAIACQMRRVSSSTG